MVKLPIVATSIRRAAKELHIDESTLRYRMGRKGKSTAQNTGVSTPVLMSSVTSGLDERLVRIEQRLERSEDTINRIYEIVARLASTLEESL